MNEHKLAHDNWWYRIDFHDDFQDAKKIQKCEDALQFKRDSSEVIKAQVEEKKKELVSLE